MTFQVMIVGADGIALGSDRLACEYSPYQRPDASRGSTVRQITEGTKILVSADKSIVCAHAGSNASREMAEAIAADACESDLPETEWITLAKRLVNSISTTLPTVREEVLVIRRSVVLSAFKVVREYATTATIMTVKKYICAGDVSSSARFIPTHLWTEDMGTEALRRLALLEVVAAHRENPSSVGEGYNVALLRKNSPVSLESFSPRRGNEIFEQFLVVVRDPLTKL
jgi:hypothetical protein